MGQDRNITIQRVDQPGDDFRAVCMWIDWTVWVRELKEGARHFTAIGFRKAEVDLLTENTTPPLKLTDDECRKMVRQLAALGFVHEEGTGS